MKTNIIKKAIISEKAYKGMERGIYTFLIEKTASKNDVANAVKKYFSVDAVKVNITTISAKRKRVNKTRKFVSVGAGKKAVVWLKKGQTISALTAKTDSSESGKLTQKTVKSKEKPKEKEQV